MLTHIMPTACEAQASESAKDVKTSLNERCAQQDNMNTSAMAEAQTKADDTHAGSLSPGYTACQIES